MFKYEKRINSYDEYVNEIKKISELEETNQLWFRGQNHSSFDLTLGLLRNSFIATNSYGNFIKPIATNSACFFSHGQTILAPSMKNLMENFMKVCNKYNFPGYEIRNSLEWMALAQHYGLPTLLLDWTDSLNVALFFAMDGIDENSGNEWNDSCSVYILSPNRFNNLLHSIPKSISLNNYEQDPLRKYIENDIYLPIAVKPERNNNRLINQKGNFILWGYNFQPLNLMPFSNQILYRLEIPYAKVKEINAELVRIGITKDYIYGKYTIIDNVSIKIKQSEYERFLVEIEELVKQQCMD